eukprot:2129782-Rhodomonas_salina.5
MCSALEKVEGHQCAAERNREAGQHLRMLSPLVGVRERESDLDDVCDDVSFLVVVCIGDMQHERCLRFHRHGLSSVAAHPKPHEPRTRRPIEISENTIEIAENLAR